MEDKQGMTKAVAGRDDGRADGRQEAGNRFKPSPLI
uniref:Uncharacterized protein n=1 Tax=Neisseria meningitidis alpha275 TaxID=295996 RepID=C6SJ75_NEIME|nr:hypothetical protein predicted by Glimmer/Critica [Neisseria meningitidis alpha275]